MFQVVFGVTVFGVTRHHYLQSDQAAVTPMPSPASPHGTGSNLLNTGPAGEMEQLMNLFPTQPASEDPQAILANADNHFGLGQYQQAAEGYSQLIRMGSSDAEIYNNLGITLHYLGRSAEALTVLDQGVAINPEYQRIWLTRGFVSSQLGRIDQARKALRRATALGADTEVGQSAQQMLDQLGG
jgi:tetratricopeptide (TPR) repeat protein